MLADEHVIRDFARHQWVSSQGFWRTRGVEARDPKIKAGIVHYFRRAWEKAFTDF